MKIESIAAVFPTREMTNEAVLDEICRRSTEFSGNLPFTLKYIDRCLKASGSNVRYWCGEDETPLDLTVRACQQAIAGLGDSNQIDLVIWAGVYPLLMEPSSANLLAHRVGLETAECIDIKLACDGWMKAVKIAAMFIESGMYRRVMVVNGEFVMTRGFGIYPDMFGLSSHSQIEWRFPSFTLGEGAAATILGPDEDNRWQITNTSRNDLFDLCTITMPWYGTCSSGSLRVAKDGPGRFTSYGADLRKHGYPLAIKEFHAARVAPTNVDAFFTHSSSKKDWSDVARDVGLVRQFHDIYSHYGNVVSAAVPAAMAIGVRDGSLQRGHRVLALVASAGMSFSTVYFRF